MKKYEIYDINIRKEGEKIMNKKEKIIINIGTEEEEIYYDRSSKKIKDIICDKRPKIYFYWDDFFGKYIVYHSTNMTEEMKAIYDNNIEKYVY